MRKGQHAAGDINANCIPSRAPYTYSLTACRSSSWSQCKYVGDYEPKFTESNGVESCGLSRSGC
eukprot:1444425-Pyramimonas_sp.AAC.1